MNELFHSIPNLMSFKNSSNKFNLKCDAEYYMLSINNQKNNSRKDNFKQNISKSKVRLNPILETEHKQIASKNNLSVIQESFKFTPQYDKSKIQKQSLSPTKLIANQRVETNNYSKESKDKPRTQSYNNKDDERSIELLKSIILKPKLPKLYNGKHILEDDINLKFNIPSIFSASCDENKLNHKLVVSFLEGHNEKVLQKCIDLLQSESDIFLLENNFPGVYKDYINTYDPKNRSQLIIPMTANSMISGNTNLLDNVSASNLNKLNSKNLMRILPLLNSIDIQDSNQTINSYSNCQSQNRKQDITGRMSLFGIRFANLPKVTPEQFKNSLLLFQELSTNSKLICFFSGNKYNQVDLGFAEIIIDQNNLKYCHISKLFVSKVYRKMNLTLKIYFKFIENLFNIYDIQKLSLNIIPGNEKQANDLLNMGFKFEKIITKNNTKYKFLTLKRKGFMDLLMKSIQTE